MLDFSISVYVYCIYLYFVFLIVLLVFPFEPLNFSKGKSLKCYNYLISKFLYKYFTHKIMILHIKIIFYSHLYIILKIN